MKAINVAAATFAICLSVPVRANPGSAESTRTQAECASLFMTLDKDGDGRISRSEANADAAIALAFEKLQLGDSGSMSVDAFMDACQKPGARPHNVK